MRPSPAGTSITLPPDTGSRKEIEMKTRNRILHAALACALLSFAAAAAAQEEPARQTAPQASAPPDAEQQAMMAAWQKAATPGPQHPPLAEQDRKSVGSGQCVSDSLVLRGRRII